MNHTQTSPRSQVFLEGDVKEFVGTSDKAIQIRNYIEIMGRNSSINVLIRGETGSGKEVVAYLIHANSDRRDQPMVRINCSQIPDNLMESELFGIERGAFAGAMRTKKGLIELAEGGTVFLDGIGELPLPMQTKLLAFLDHKKFKRVGGIEDIEVDARVIAATARNLELGVQKGEFRKDLLYRINVMEIVIPPLRERREDIPALCAYYLDYYNKQFGREIRTVAPEFMRELMLYDWKGNVRELKNVFERCFLFSAGEVLEQHVEFKRPDWREDARTGESFELKNLDDGPVDLEQEVMALERIYMEQALTKCNGNVTKAAELLGISRFAMKRKLDKTKTKQV
ncbi:MAG: sigma-54-dependent Fis family transcriptional regulator [Lachnospiraceae bacterium]|nr:sigma-54-dependent Fis family transcriptional regulator [Lachnospiraceae bacterium]